MKKQVKTAKKLSLNKVRLMKNSDMKTINGGYGMQFENNDDPVTKPRTQSGGL